MKNDEPLYIKNYRIPHSQKDEVGKTSREINERQNSRTFSF